MLAVVTMGISLLVGVQSPTPAKAALASSGLVLNLDASVPGSFNGTSWLDQSGNSRNATAMNSPTFDATDGSFTLNGTNQYFNLGNILNMTSAFSVEVTFLPNSISGVQGLVTRQNSNVGGNYFVGMENAKAFYYVESNPWGIRSASDLSVGTKYTATMVYDSQKAITPYLNGAQNGVKTTFGGDLFTNNVNLQIGALLNSSNPSNFFAGKIYSVRIYNRALTAAEVAENYAESTNIVLSNYGVASSCVWSGSQRNGTRFIAGTTSTITKVRLQVEHQAPDSVINPTRIEIHRNTGGVIGTLVGTLQPTIIDAASTLPGAGRQTRRVAYTGSVNVVSGTSYWISFNNSGQTISFCGSGSFGTQASGWSVERSGSNYFFRFSGGGSYTTWFEIFQFELSLGPADLTPPIITGPGSLTTSTIATSSPENAAWSHIYTANEVVTWAISGADAGSFTLNANGTLSLSARNFEVPNDSNGDGIFTVVVSATDGPGNVASQTLNLTISNANDPPVFITGSGAATHAITLPENETSVLTFSGSDVDPNTTLQWVFANSSLDRNRFAINSSTGALSFLVAPDFENPTDTNRDNIYTVNIGLSDGTVLTIQTLSVQITNVNELSSIATPTIAASAFKGVQINISVIADTPGRVQFFVDGKRIPSCRAISTTGSAPTVTAICPWKPPVHGMRIITARLTPTNLGLSASLSSQLRVNVARRTGLR